MKQYLELMHRILTEGHRKGDRTGTGTLSLFGTSMRFDLTHGFPLLTTKKIHIPSVIHELLWFISGNTNIEYLRENSVRIWDEWADKNGELGPVYGQQWRSWPTPTGGSIDQLQEVINQLKTNPDSRRIIVSAWNVSDLGSMALPPCHLLFQFYSRELTGQEKLKALTECDSLDSADDKALLMDYFLKSRFIKQKDLDILTTGMCERAGIPTRALSCQLYQRSADFFLGVPFNIASYSLLIYMVAKLCNMVPYEFIHVMGDTHLYLDHLEQAQFQLGRSPKRGPYLVIEGNQKTIDDFTYEDFQIHDYYPGPVIPAKVSV